MNPYLARSILNNKISTLAHGSEWLSEVAADLQNRVAEISAVLHSVEIPAPESDANVALRWLTNATNREIREALIKARGARSASVLRTKLNSQLEQQRGRRHASSGQPRVHDPALQQVRARLVDQIRDLAAE